MVPETEAVRPRHGPASRNSLVHAVVVRNELRFLYSRSARTDLDLVLSLAVQLDRPGAGTLDARFLSRRSVLDRLPVHAPMPRGPRRAIDQNHSLRREHGRDPGARRKETRA